MYTREFFFISFESKWEEEDIYKLSEKEVKVERLRSKSWIGIREIWTTSNCQGRM